MPVGGAAAQGGSAIAEANQAADSNYDAFASEAPAAPFADDAWANEHHASQGAEDDPAVRASGWLPVALAAAAIAAWSGFFGWAVILRQSQAIAPDQWAWWTTQWAVPVLLVLVVLLLVMRTSRRETRRFTDIAHALSRESELLERRLLSINTELSLSRDFVAAQGRDLESLGRVAVERLSSSAARLDELVGRNGMQIDRIAEVSSAALDNMDKLRSQLPVIANAAKDVTNNIGNAGRTAHLQLEELVSGFQRLNEFGLASERQVFTFRERIEAAIDSFAKSSQDLANLAEDRFEALAERSAQQADTTRVAEQAALSAWRERSETHAAALRATLEHLAADHERLVAEAAERMARFEQAAQALATRLDNDARQMDEQFALRRASTEAEAAEQRQVLERRLDEIDQAIARRRNDMEQAAARAAEALATKLADFDNTVASQRKLQVAEAELLGSQMEAIGRKVADFSALLGKSGTEGIEAAGIIDKAMAELNSRLGDMRHALSGTDLEIGQLTDSAVRLLELIQAGSEHTRTQIPEALRSTEAGLKGLENRVFTLRDTLREAGDGGRALAGAVADARDEVTKAAEALDRAQSELSSQSAEREAQLANLRNVLAEAKAESAGLAAEIEQRLSGTISQLADAAAQTTETLRVETSGEVEALAERLGEQSSAAIARVLQGRAAELVGRLEEAIDAAALASRDTAIQMRDQLTKVDELAGNLEARVARAREKAEEQIDNDFARRAALITESLNSSAIDIARALSTDVSETAWASYLRGDRGIFTRRAVSLLENAEAKAVQAHYEGDGDFREHVNRYIHDFESMLRQLLSTRDGNALGVTLLSSDMGKLYVALAQGIERLRT